MEGLSQANSVLTRFNSEFMAQLAHMTVTMNETQAKLNTFSLATTNTTRTQRIFTLGVAGATILMGVKTAWTRKRATRMMHTSRSDWVESERGVNDV